MSRLPTLFISHGGGPWPYMEEMNEPYAKTANWLAKLPQTFSNSVKAILCISGHWEEKVLTVSAAEHPPMIYDYYGFPEHTYRIRYPAPGSPVLAARVQHLLSSKGLENASDSQRGFDHGTFVPLMLMYPQANIPIVQLSMLKSYDPAVHIRVGQALSVLRNEGVLIIGSGLSYHNLRAFNPSANPMATQFEQWLCTTVEEPSQAERFRHLTQWSEAPSARLAHPREDHLIPLMVAAGAAADEPGRRVFIDTVLGIPMASYQFG